MRFEAEYRALQAPQYSSHYIEYGALKNAIKTEHGLARKERRLANHSATLRALYVQCQRVETLYRSEHLRLSKLVTQTLDTGRDFGRCVTSAEAVAIAWQLLFEEAVMHAKRVVVRLLLFSKFNAAAAQRILDKLHRACKVEGEEGQFELTNFDFSHTSAFSIGGLLSRLNMKSAASVKGYHAINDDQIDSVLEPFSARFDSAGEQPALWRKQKLSIMIELLGFFRRSYELAKHTIPTDNPSSVPLENFYWMLLSRIKSEAAESDSAILDQIDESGWCPLHYAAEFGLEDVISAFRGHRNASPASLPSLDSRNEIPVYYRSPLWLAICSRNKNAVDEMLLLIREQGFMSIDQYKSLPPHFARAAVELGEKEILVSILKFGTDVNDIDELGQPLLCTAVSRMPDACRILLQHGAVAEATESSSGRSALCLACISGDISIVQLLLEHGASYSTTDSRDWLPIEHAAYRGHLEIVRFMASWEGCAARMQGFHLEPFANSPLIKTDGTKASPVPWSQYPPTGSQRYCVWIRLGNHDANHPTLTLERTGFLMANDGSQLPDKLVHSVSVSVFGRADISREWRLPILESTVNNPWLFETNTLEDVKLVWRLYRHSGQTNAHKQLYATGISLMSTLSKGFQQNRESVVRSATVPMLTSAFSSYSGSITFSYFWSKSHPPPERLHKPRYWEFGNGIGGHRGSGKNTIDDKKLQIGENTAQSFSTAISAGAAFLEFDVQLTKDLVPVVYHDFLISETGTDSTVQTVTYEQFKTISAIQGPKRSPKSRSSSMQSTDHQHLESFKERMDKTHFNKVNGFKANTRGNFIHEQTCSLEELFQHVPSSVPLNIEVKYPMLFETEDWDMEPLAIKTDIFVDTILDKVYEHAEGRMIVFSSFSPEVCIALSTKQRTFPVFFLSKTAAPKGEIRSSSLQQAVHFAKTWGLPGIVAECTPFIHCPRLIKYIKSAGLTVTSFGVGNSNKENVKVQFDGGINAVITDSIRAIKELREVVEDGNGPPPLRPSVYP